MAHAIIRLRGQINVKPKIKDTLKYLRLNRVNHCVVLPDNETTQGMLKVAKDYVTWGEIDGDLLAELIQTRGRLVGDKPITDDHVKANTDYTSIKEFAAAICDGKLDLKLGLCCAIYDGNTPVFLQRDFRYPFEYPW